MAHIVKATLIVAKVDSTERYFDKGAILPPGVSTEERKRLVAAGVVVYVKDATKATEQKPADDQDGKKPADDQDGKTLPPAK